MSIDDPMDEQLRGFLDWQAGRLDGTPDAHGMALRIGSRSGARTTDRGRLVWAFVALALVVALIVTALVGARLTERPAAPGRLAYAMNDNIYLADQDGANPRKVTAAVPRADDTGGGPSYLLGDGGAAWGRGPDGRHPGGTAWAPDGRHLLFYIQGDGGQLTGHIADATGTVVASIPNIWVGATWSPDSTRIEAWTGWEYWTGTTQIDIVGIDGTLQESLPLPAGYVRFREHPGFWAPDGRSVYVRLGQGLGSAVDVWQLQIDGSAPRQLAADDPRTSPDLTFSHDGSRLAFVNHPPVDAPLSGTTAWYRRTLSVSNADGTDPRELVVGQTASSAFDSNHVTADGPHVPMWSPDDQRIAYSWWVETVDGRPVDNELRIVDVASGAVHTVVADQADEITPIGWSPAGDKLLYERSDQAGQSTLWTVNVDGTDGTRVAGAESGYWQPVATSP